VRRRPALLFLIYSAIFHIGLLGMLDVLVNFYFVSLGHSPETIGLLQALPRLAGFITSVPIGLLANRIGTRRLLILATIGAALALWLQLIPILPMLAISRFLFGLCYGAQQIATSPQMVSLVDPKERTGFFAAHNGISMGAMAFGSIVGGYMPAWIVSLSSGIVSPEWTASVTTPFAYGAAIFAAGALGMLSAVPLFLTRESAPSDATAPDIPKRTWNAVGIPWARMVFLSIPMLTFGFTGGLTFPFFNLFWRTQFDLPDQTVGQILSIGWIGMALIPLAGSTLERRFGRAGSLGITLIIASAAFFGLGMLPALPISVAMFALAISFRNTMQPLFQPLVLETLPPELHNVISSVNMVLWNIGWFGSTAMGGFLLANFGFGVMMNIVTVGLVITAALVVIIFRQRERALKAALGSD